MAALGGGNQPPVSSRTSRNRNEFSWMRKEWGSNNRADKFAGPRSGSRFDERAGCKIQHLFDPDKWPRTYINDVFGFQLKIESARIQGCPRIDNECLGIV